MFRSQEGAKGLEERTDKLCTVASQHVRRYTIRYIPVKLSEKIDAMCDTIV